MSGKKKTISEKREKLLIKINSFLKDRSNCVDRHDTQEEEKRDWVKYRKTRRDILALMVDSLSDDKLENIFKFIRATMEDEEI